MQAKYRTKRTLKRNFVVLAVIFKLRRWMSPSVITRVTAVCVNVQSGTETAA